jgi:hypothetical protein
LVCKSGNPDLAAAELLILSAFIDWQTSTQAAQCSGVFFYVALDADSSQC